MTLAELNGDRKGVGGPASEEGKARARANLLQNRKPGAVKGRHGAHSVRAGDEVVKRKREEIIAILDGDLRKVIKEADRWAVTALAMNLRQQDLLNKHLEEQSGPVMKSGDIRPALDFLIKLQREALKYMDALGMTPASRNRMGLKAAQGLDLAGMFAETDDGKEVQADDVAPGADDETSGEGVQ